MNDALTIAATGMQAQQTHVETIANNLANVNTPGFKKARVIFSDLVVRNPAQVGLAAPRDGTGPLDPLARSGAGVSIAAMAKVFDMGDLRRTDAPLDVTIQGDGFLEVVMPDGSRAFTRGGSLQVNKDGHLASSAGFALKPGITVPDGMQRLLIQPDGRVQAILAGQATPVDIGQLELVRFTNTQGLLAQGNALYRSSEASGEPVAARPGEDGVGTLVQGALEGSNVKMVDEMVALMIAQRGYEANAKIVQAADDMAAMVNGLRR